MKTKNLSLIEAIKSGKPFRRLTSESGTLWFTRMFDSDDCIEVESEHGGYWVLDTADVLATDWEIKAEPMTIWANVYPTNVLLHSSEKAARRNVGKGGVTRKFVEVIDD